jgi:hypothetical protein
VSEIVAPDSSRTRASNTVLLGAAGIGALVSLALGVYADRHNAAGQALFTLGFSGTINMKAWLATVALALAIVQIFLALWMYGKVGSHAPDWVGPLHRIVGLAAFVVVLPVAYHCLWSLGFVGDVGDTRRFVHSVLGCAFFGAFTMKVLAVRSTRMPSWALPVLGALVFSLLVAIWLTSSLWFFTNVGFPKF